MNSESGVRVLDGYMLLVHSADLAWGLMYVPTKKEREANPDFAETIMWCIVMTGKNGHMLEVKDFDDILPELRGAEQ